MFYSKIRFREKARSELILHPKSYPASLKDLVYSMVLKEHENRGTCHFVYRFDNDDLPPVLTLISQRRPMLEGDDRYECLTKEYDPSLYKGQKLKIRTKVNATRKHEGERRDIVQLMKWEANAQGLSVSELPNRLTMAQEAGAQWLGKQGDRCGFSVEDLVVSDYGRYEGFHPNIPAISFLELQAIIEVKDPEGVRDILLQGFGKAKGFGFGLIEAMPYNQ